MYFNSFLRFFQRIWSQGRVKGKRPRNGRSVVTSPGLERLEVREMLSGTPPTIVSVTPSDNSSTTNSSPVIQVTYSEAMSASAFSANDYVLLNASGTPVPITSVTETSTTVATINYTGPLVSDSYSLFVKGNLVTASSALGGLPLSTAQELIAANAGQNNVSVANVSGTGTLETPTNTTVSGVNQVVEGDLNGDGIPELVVVNYNTLNGAQNGTRVTIFQGLSGGGFSSTPVTLSPTTDIRTVVSVALGNISGHASGLPDIILLDQQDSTVGFLINNMTAGQATITAASFSTLSSVSVGSTPDQVVVGAFGSNGRIDLAVAHNGSGDDFNGGSSTAAGVTVLLNTGSAAPFNAANTTEVDSGKPVQSLAVENVTGPGGYLDIVAAEDPSTGDVDLLLNNGQGKFTLQGTYATGVANPDSIAVADFNGDGYLDVVVASQSTNATQGGVAVLLNQAGTGFGTPIQTAVDSGIGLENVVVSDINQDGLPDLLVSTQLPSGNITLVSASTNGIVVTSDNNGLSVGEQVVIQNVGGFTEANGTFTVSAVTQNTFTLENTSSDTGTYTSGGTWTLVDSSLATNDNVFALIGTGGGHFAPAVPYLVGATGTPDAATTTLAVTPSPLIPLTTFTTVGSTVSSNLITNGNFASSNLSGGQGNLLGWSTYSITDDPGSYGAWLPQTGTTSPLSGTTVPAPTGNYQAMLDENNLVPVLNGDNTNTATSYAGTNVLYQEFTVPATATSLSLSLSLYINNTNAGVYSDPTSNTSLDYRTPAANQQVRVDLLSVASGSVTGASNGNTIDSSDPNAIIITTGSTAGLTTGMEVNVENVTGNTAANGLWTVTVLNATQFELEGSNGAVGANNGVFTGGGTWSLPILGTTAAAGLLQNLFITNPGTALTCNSTISVSGSMVVASDSITGVTNSSTGPIIITTNSTAALTTGETVTISGVGGNLAANGIYTITVINSTEFSLNGTTGSGNYTSGGTWSLSLLSLLAGKTIMLRIAGVNNQGLLLVGVDNVQATVTFSDTTPPTLTGLALRNPGILGGANGTTPYTDDPTLIGTVGALGGVNNVVKVEFSPNNDGFNGTDVLATTTFDANGHFQFTLPNVPTGLNTIGLEVVDVAGNVYDTSFTFYMLDAGNVSNWEAEGPQAVSTTGEGVNYTSVSGDVTVTIPDLNDPTGNSWFVGSDNGGVWKTTDGGASWTPLTDNLTTSSGQALPVPIGGLAQSVSNPQILYAGTGVGNDNLDSFGGIGVLKSTNDGQTWTLAGNSGTVLAGAKVTSVVINATNPKIVYVAVASGGQNGPGIYESTNGGQTWTDVLVQSEMFLAANGAAVASTDPIASVTDLIIDPFNSNRLIAGLGNIGLSTASDTGGVWLSVNGGSSWNQIVGGANSATIPNSSLPTGTSLGRVTVAIGDGRIGDESTVYVLIGTPPSSTTAPNLNYGTTFGLYKTSNNLFDFTKVELMQNIGTGAQPDQAGTHDFVPIDLFGDNASNSGALVVDPNDPNVVTIGGSDVTPDIVTNSVGQSFDLTHELIRVDTGDMLDASYEVNGQIINNGDDAQKYLQSLSQGGVYAAQDAYTGEGVYWYDLVEGASGTTGNLDLLPPTINSLAINAAGQLLVGTSGGIWLGTSLGFGYDYTSGGTGILAGQAGTAFSAPGMTFTAVNGNLQISDMTSVAIDPENPGVYYTSQTFTGSAVTTSAQTWESQGLTGPTLANGTNLGITTAADVVAVNPATVGTPVTLFRTWEYANASALTPEISIDNGAAFAPISAGSPSNGATPAGAITAFAVDPVEVSGAYDLLFGTNKVYLTSTTSSAWQVLDNGHALSSNSTATVTALSFAPTQGGGYYVGMSDGQVFVSTNSGSTFSEEDTGLPTTPVNSITVSPTNAGTAYILYAAGNGVAAHVFMTNNFGVTWTNISANLPNVAAYSLVVDPNVNIDAPNGTLYLANQVGVYYSINGGQSWARLGTGLPNVPVVQLQYNSTLQVLVAATLGRGIFTLGTNPLAPLSNEVILESTTGSPIPITINDPGLAGGTYTVTATSSDTSLVPDSSSNLILAGSGANRTLTIVPATNAFGTSVITVTLIQGTLTFSQTFLLTVNVENQLITANSTDTLNFGPDIIDSFVSSNPTLIPTSGLVLSGGSEVLTITPTANMTGLADLTLIVTDPSGKTATQLIQILVNTPQTLPFSDNFHRPASAFLGLGWTENVGGFSVSNEAAVASSGRLNIATVDLALGATSANVSVQANISSLAPGQYFGLLARYAGTGDQNYYLGGLDATATGYQIYIYRNIAGAFTPLFTTNVTTTKAISGTLVFQVVGPSLELFFNGALVGSADDIVLTGAGTVGVRTTSLVTFTDFVGTALPPTTPALPFSDPFTTGTTPVNQLDSNWINQVGNFNVAAANGTATGSASLNLATVYGLNVPDVAVQATINVTTGEYAGLVADYTGSGDQNYYLGGIVASAGGYQAYLYRNVNGVFTSLLATANPTFSGSADGVLELEVYGSSLELFLGNTLIAYANDTTLTGGSVGMRVTAGAAVSNFNASCLDREYAFATVHRRFQHGDFSGGEPVDQQLDQRGR